MLTSDDVNSTDGTGAPPGPERDVTAVIAALRAEPNDLARAKAVREHAYQLGRAGVPATLAGDHEDALLAEKLITATKWREAHRAGVADRKTASRADRAAPAVAESASEPAITGTDHTDDGNAEMLITASGDVIRRVSDMGAWYWWDSRRWDRDPEDRYVRERAKDLARTLPGGGGEAGAHKRNSLSSAGLSATLRVAQSDPRVTVLARDLDANPELLNTPSGVLNLRDCTLTAHDPALMLTRITAHPVALDAPHPQWDRFLAETFGEEGDVPDADRLSRYVQRLCGLALLGDVRDHVLPFLYGAGANGKGVLLLVLQGLLGASDTGGYAVSAPDGFLMTSSGTAHPTEIARLRGARLVVCSEQTSGKRFDEARVKRLTGGDLLTGRFMRGDFFDFEPSHLIIVASNHLPAVREGGPSFWRRVRLIPFDRVVPPERRNPELHSQLLADEGAAILGWMARGAADVIAMGLMDPERVKAATEDYRVSEDSLAAFVRDECLIPTAAAARAATWCTVADFRARYEAHCSDTGVDRDDWLSAKALTSRLTREYEVTRDRNKMHGRIYRGIGLFAGDDPQEPPAAGDR